MSKKKNSSEKENEIINAFFKVAKGNATLEMMLDIAVVSEALIEDARDYPQNQWDRASPVTKVRINDEEYEVQLHLVKDKTHWLRGAQMMEAQEI